MMPSIKCFAVKPEKKSKNKSAHFHLRCGSSRNEQSGSTHIAGLPAKSLLASPLPLKAPCWEVRKNQSLYDFAKRISGFCLGCCWGALVGGDISLFQINGIFMFNVQLLPVLRTLDLRIKEIMAF